MPTMSAKSTRLLLPEEEIEGDRQGTVDFVFCRIGEPVPLMPTQSNCAFDLSNPPLQPLVVSERHRLLFLAHNDGFLVAITKDVIELAKGAKGKDKCVQGSSVVNVQIGRVSILALSGDNSMLAAAVGGEIHLFYVQSLLDKVQEPEISGPLSKSGIVKDLKWRSSFENSFIVLSSHGLLFHGSSDLQLKDVTDNVDAADWSVDGKFVAIARKDTVSILSSNFEEILGIPLLFQSWAVDSGSEIKVDSIKWVRHDSIVIGCTQLMEDGDEEGYLVQVIVSGEHKFTEASCKPLVFSFPDLFEGLSVDMLPARVGPYLLADYLDCWDVAITSNKKNIDQHISLLRWLVDDNGYEVVSLELGSDKYIPRIDLQDDGDDNLILGLAVDKSSLYEKIKIQSAMEFKELSPRCILLCLTCDGKLTLNHAAWVSEPSDLPKTVSPHGDNIVNKGFHNVSLTESELEITTSKLKDGLDAAISDKMHLIPGGKLESHGTLDGAEPYSQRPAMITSSFSSSLAIEEPRMPSNAGGLGIKSTDNERASDSLMVKGTGTSQLVASALTGGFSFGSRAAQSMFGVDGSNVSVSSTVDGTSVSRSFGSTINEGSSSRSQTLMPFTVDSADANHLLSSSSESNSAGIGNRVFSPPSNSTANFPPFSKPFGTLSSLEKINQSGVQASSIKSGYTGSASILHSSSVAASAKLPGSRQQLLANSTSSKPRQRLESEPQFSKQFYNVKDMVKELDVLLSSIECEGGFMDLCTISQEQSLLALEAGLDDLSEVLFVYRDEIENQRIEIQQLCNKMLEVSARQVYMKGIVQQASDHRYWAFWNSQKLSPEFEAKRLHISNLKQNLTNQLLELERHFNSLEINRFVEYDTTTTGWRAPRNSAHSRRTQSLHSVYSTINSQLAAAEQLSECLSKQMAVLNISSSTSEKRNITTKELFESIGLDPKTDAFMSPDLKSSKQLPYSSNRTSLSSETALKELSWNCVANDVKSFKLESARRKRDSLDKSWAHFEPSRTTMKRNSTKEQVRSNLDIVFREAKEVFDSQVKAFDIAQKSGMSNFSRASSKVFDSQSQASGTTKRSSNEAASFLSKTTSSNSQSLEQSPSKGIQEKSSKIAIDAQSKPIFRWAKDPPDMRAEPNTSWSSTSSQVFQSSGTRSSLFAAPSIFSNSNSNKDEKFGSPFMLNVDASSTLSNSSSAATKTTLLSKPTSVSTHMKFSSNVSPLKTSSAAETRSQLKQGTGLKNEVDTLVSSAQEITKKPTVHSSPLSASTAQAPAPLTSSSLSSLQFGNSMPPNIFLSSSKSNAPSSFSNELSMPSLARVDASEVSQSLNKIGSELEHATSQSTNKSAIDVPPNELSSFPSKTSLEPTTNTPPASVIDTVPPKKVGLHVSASEKNDNTNDSKLQQITSQIHSTSMAPPLREEPSLPEAESAMAIASSIMTTENLDANLSQEDEMEEEALDTNSMLNMESLGGFSSQSTPSSNAQKPNPFGSSFLPASAGSASPQLSWNVSQGQLFRPPSFSLPESQPPQLSQSTGSSFTGGLSGGFSSFGQPAQLGVGQQALGSVLGSFGQSRQLGTGSLGFASASGSSGGFAGAATGGGFAGAATGLGFAGAATGGGFVGAATAGGFAGVATAGGFAAAAAAGAAAGFGGGFAPVGGGGGFGGASSGGGLPTGGFGGFGSFQGSGFSAFGAGRPPAEFLTQMRK